MLYKNLPQEELNKVMRVRTCLDYVAALTFLLKGDVGNARAVITARKEYKQICSSFSSSREENQRKKTLNPIPERTKVVSCGSFMREDANGSLNCRT